MKLAVGRIASIVITISGWMLFAIRTMIDLIGYSTLPDDVIVANHRLNSFLIWLSAIPWWALLAFALVSTIILFFVVWPRTVFVNNIAGGFSDYAKGQEIVPDGVMVMINGLDSDEYTLSLLVTLKNRSAADMKLLLDEASISVDGEKAQMAHNVLPVQITAGSSPQVEISTGRVKKYRDNAKCELRVIVRFGRDSRCSSSVTFAYEVRLLHRPTAGWKVHDPAPQSLRLLEYALKT